MRILHLITLVLLIVGGLNWGLVGLLEWNLVTALFGPGTLVSRAVYVLVGLSALWHLAALFIAPNSLELSAGRSHPVR